MFYKLIKDLERPMLFDRSFRDFMFQGLDPKRRVTRYHREWRVSAPQEVEGYIFGKLGFLHPTVEARTVYDERTHDFVPREQRGEDVSFSHFVISLEDNLLAFELKPPQIRNHSFIGALQDFLREGHVPYETSPVPEPESFDDWVASVDRVTELTVTGVVPNPRTNRPRNLVDRLEAMRASRVTIKVLSSEDEGLNLDEQLLQQALGHVTSGYGSEKAKAMRNGKVVHYDSKSHVRTITIQGTEDDEPKEIHAEIRDVIIRVKAEL